MFYTHNPNIVKWVYFEASVTIVSSVFKGTLDVIISYTLYYQSAGMFYSQFVIKNKRDIHVNLKIDYYQYGGN